MSVDPLPLPTQKAGGVLPASGAAVTTINLTPCYPAAGYPGLEGPFQHPPAQHRFGRKLDSFGYARCPAARTILHPILGKIQLAIQQHIVTITGIPKKHPYLAVLDPARSSAILPLDLAEWISFSTDSVSSSNRTASGLPNSSFTYSLSRALTSLASQR